VRLRTSGGLTVSDITDDVQDAVREQAVSNGLCCIRSRNLSCSVRVNEWERGFFEDFAVMLRRLSSADLYGRDWEIPSESTEDEPGQEFGSRPSLAMSMLLGPTAESVPVRDGELCLGTWQRILLLELDRESDGRWLVSVIGV
jgi:secondary thiamine-phosphate synthase enzyme